MKVKIIKLKETGFCYGVKRAIEILKKAADENVSVDCVGELVHNPQVMHNLKKLGIKVIDSPADISSPVVAISAHGVSPQVETQLESKALKLIDATCPSVKKVHQAVKRLTKSGYTIVVFGDARHAEVKGILGWTQGRGIAALESAIAFPVPPYPRKIAVVSQTTQVPENYLKFVKELLDRVMKGNSEIIILDTVCQEVRRRQRLSQGLAAKSDLILVVGGKNSANSRRLVELCAALAETHLVETADEIQSSWLAGKKSIGVTSGTSTSQESIDEVITKLQILTL